MGYLMRLELTREDLLIKLANYYSIRGTQLSANNLILNVVNAI